MESARVLIVSAQVGAGHLGAAKELARRLEAAGDLTRIVSFNDALPVGTRWLLETSYVLGVRYVPWIYDFSYRVFYRLRIISGPMIVYLSWLTSRRMLRWIDEYRPDIIVSTYPFSSSVLGRLSQHGKVTVPIATYITDFGVHPLWVHDGVDLHLCVHPQSAEQAAALVDGLVTASGPLVPTSLRTTLPERTAARVRLGLPLEDRLVLVVAGKFAFGDVVGTFDALVHAGVTPVVVCGTNKRMYRKLAARGHGVVFGWTDEMPLLLAACDVMVENAGGLSCMEAFAAGLPVVTCAPIAGHGRENASNMGDAGVVTLAPTLTDLPPALTAALDDAGAATAAAARNSMFNGDAAEDVRRLVASART
jgi:UDP-N-acetylglucosamine:LPS N-acetylglucosamine transferase